MPSSYVPDRGDIVWISLDPAIGHEQKGRRPVLILTNQLYNGRSGMAVAVPITSQIKGYPFEARIITLHDKVTGVALVDHLRAIDWQQRQAEFIIKALPTVVMEVAQKAKRLLEY
ncbi:MAG: type II toxin-antitoxin system PemK/MazF family toxin [bacterium]